MITLNDIRQAQDRLKPYIRRTPLIAAQPVKVPAGSARQLYLKLENMQVTGSFKARGAVNRVLTLTPEQATRGLVTASGGNHGQGVAYAGWLAKVPATIYLSGNTPKEKAHKLEQWGARAIFVGEVFDDANRAALAAAERDGLVYVHAFADPAVIAGQGTVGLEMLQDNPDLDVLLVAIGGGGLMSGISTAVKAMKPNIKVIGIEPIGAPTLYESLRQGYVVELPEIRTTAGTLAPRQSAVINFEIIKKNVDEIVLVSDEEMLEAAHWLWDELSIAAELSGAAALAALLTGKVRVSETQKVGVLVCGSGTDALLR